MCPARRLILAGFFASIELTGSTPTDAWPGDSYTGPLTAVSGALGAAQTQLLNYGTYPAAGSNWRYKADFTQASLAQFISVAGSTWKDENFDDSAWQQGASHLGYGDTPRDEVTQITRVDYNTTTTGTQSGPVALFRTTFTLTDLPAISAVTGTVMFDDSCAVYVNGTRVFRHADLTDNALLTEYTETTTTTTRENAEAPITVPLSLLHAGVNTIAVEVHQHDAGSSDLSFDLKLSATRLTVPEVRWTAAGGPWHLTGDVTVPAGVTLIIEPGARVFADETRRLIVNGVLRVLGTDAAPVHFSHRPGAPLVDDPREPGTQAVPPKWGGILFQDSLSPDNLVQGATFYGAQPAAVEGCITVVRSACLISKCYFTATYLHGVYGKNCSLTVEDSIFPDVFPPGKEALGETLDNLSEFVEVDSPPDDAGVVNNPAFFKGFPIGGYLRLYRNHFYGSSGHNDLVDITSGKWGETPILDAQDNHFHGPTGDEHIDLNGDAYIAGNIFENCTKDIYTSDHGYANAISSDAGGTDTTVVVVRNVFSHCDHAVNVKRGCGAIFEHNTVADVNADYHFERTSGMTTFTQDVKNSALNFFIPEDTGRAGDGAYAAWNILYGQAGGGALPRVLSWADMDLTGQPAKTTKLEMNGNVVDPGTQDPVTGQRHPDNIFAAVWQPLAVNPLFTDRPARNYTLAPGSPAKAAGPFGLEVGAGIPAGCYLGNAPSGSTAQTYAAITVGGPGIFAYKWRLDGGPWSGAASIAPGVFPRTGPTVRSAVLTLENLAAGAHLLEVSGQDFAGNWQTVPTTASWTVTASEPPATYPAWLTWYGVTDGSDTDSDGLTTMAEYAFAGDPLQPAAMAAQSAAGTGSLTMELQLPADSALPQGHGRPGVTYYVETSPDLNAANWTPVAVKSPLAAWTGTVTVGIAAAGVVPVTVSAPMTAGRRYLRVRAVWNP